MLKKPRILILEDQPMLAEDLADRLSNYEVLGPFSSASEVLQLEDMPDVGLLDIELGEEMDGIDVAVWLNEKKLVPIVFITRIADDSRVFQRIETLSFPKFYISKPITQNQLKITIANAIESGAADRLLIKQPEFKISHGRLMVRNGIGMEVVDLEGELLYAETNGETTRLVTKESDALIVSLYLKAFLLKSSQFTDSLVRVSRYHAVNIHKVKKVIDGKHNLTKDKMIKLDGTDKLIPLSSSYRRGLFERFRSL